MRLKENKRDFDDSILKRESAFFNAYKAIGKRLETKRLTRAMRLDNMGRLCKMRILAAGVAQLVERNLAKVEVASSRLVSRSRIQEKRKRQASFFSFVRSEIQRASEASASVPE